MKSIVPSSIHPRLDLRLATYAAVGAALAAPAASHSANAAVVYSGPVTLAVPQNGTGIYLDLATQTTSTTGSFTGYDINFYGSTALTFFKPSTTTLESTSTTAAPVALTLGTNIGPTSIFTTSSTSTAFQITGTEYLGLKFSNTTTGAVNYGWIQLQTTATTGYPATILGYAFENAGAAILAGQIVSVPEPGTTAALGLGALALGAVSVRRMRQRKQAVA